MAQEIEIEFKTILNEKDFNKLLHAMPFPAQPIEQVNHYFDTMEMALKQHRSALRIREKAETATLTLKQPQEEGILETHDKLTPEECDRWLKGSPVNKEHNAGPLQQMNVNVDDLIHYGSLTTRRYAFKDDGLVYVLDESNYLGRHDFELELEANNYKAGAKAFDALLGQYGIKKQPPVTKIERFFEALKHEEGEYK